MGEYLKGQENNLPLQLILQRERARFFLEQIESALVKSPVKTAQTAVVATHFILELEIHIMKAVARSLSINGREHQPSLDYQVGTYTEIICQLTAGNSQPAAIFLEERAIETMIKSTHYRGRERERLQTLGRRYEEMAQLLFQPH